MKKNNNSEKKVLQNPNLNLDNQVLFSSRLILAIECEKIKYPFEFIKKAWSESEILSRNAIMTSNATTTFLLRETHTSVLNEAIKYLDYFNNKDIAISIIDVNMESKLTFYDLDSGLNKLRYKTTDLSTHEVNIYKNCIVTLNNAYNSHLADIFKE